MCEGLTLVIKHGEKGYIQMSNRPLSEMSGSKASWNKQSITAPFPWDEQLCMPISLHSDVNWPMHGVPCTNIPTLYLADRWVPIDPASPNAMSDRIDWVHRMGWEVQDESSRAWTLWITGSGKKDKQAEHFKKMRKMLVWWSARCEYN